jgi:hypothetical protein
MRTVLASVRRHQLIAFFVLAYALTWPLIPLVSVSPLWGFPALFGPALAGIIVAAVADGRAGLWDLLGRVARWRVGARWYAVALALPAVLALAALGLHVALGGQGSFELGGCRSSTSWFSSSSSVRSWAGAATRSRSCSPNDRSWRRA